MLSSYWLEMWIPKASFSKVSRFLDIPVSEMRSIARVFEEYQPDEPNVFAVNQLIDQWEEAFPRLEKAGIRRQDFSIWLDGKYEKSYELPLDAMTLQRMGQEQLKLCLTCERKDPADWETMDPSLYSKSVEIREIWLEEDIDESLPYTLGVVPVTVSFDDGTYWQARFVPYSFLSRSQPAQRNFFWEPDMILVPFVNKLQVEKTILDLMRQQKFERAFCNMDGEAREKEDGQSVYELQIMHESVQDIPIAEILNVPLSNVSIEKQFWKLRNQQYHHQAGFDYLHYYQELIEQHFPSLRKLGIRRQDIAINFQYRYEGNCHLEFQPETLNRLGNNGISLNISCFQAAKAVARSVE